ncbi:MAG: hypothetical protein PHE54_00040 [Bacilli bacterium]|nr:hypothetical protein [Bacilli bacterium]
MNIYLLQLVGKWLSVFVVFISSIMSNIAIGAEQLIINNDSESKKNSIINEVVEYETLTTYDSKMPYNRTKILVDGEEGIVYKDNNGNVVEVLKEVVNEEVVVGTGAYGDYIGKMTGYGPDCYGCSTTGTVSCLTESKARYSLISDGIYYNDEEYGMVRILAADLTLFPCGTIIKVNSTNLGDFYGIVMDTGSAMRTAWREYNTVLVDVAFSSENDSEVRSATSSNILYEVQRWGW